MKVKSHMFDDTIERPIQNDDPTSISDLSEEEQKEYCDLMEKIENDFQKMMEGI